MAKASYIYEEGCIERFAEGDPSMNKCIEKIKEILKKEHYKAGKMPFSQQTALNLDDYERLKQKRGSNKSTVDFVIGLKGNWLLPVEAKLDVDNVDNIIKDIAAKKRHSLDLLHASDNFVHCTNFLVILLGDKNFHQKENRLKTLLRRNPAYVIHNVERFYNTYFVE